MDNDLENIELSIEEARLSISKKKDLDKLIANSIFKKVITEGYFEKESVRLVLLRADPQMQEEIHQTAINKQIDAIGYLRQYFVTISQFGRMAEKAMIDAEKTREEILVEDLEKVD